MQNLDTYNAWRMRRWGTRGYQRVGPVIGDLNYGLINFDWASKTLTLRAMKVCVPLRS